MMLLRPELKDSEIPHRTKIRGMIIQSWVSWVGDLKKELSVRILLMYEYHTQSASQESLGKISITSDIWTSRSQKSYMAVTAHYLLSGKSQKSMVLKTALIAFYRLNGAHTGANLATTMIHLLDRVGITEKVSLFYLFVVCMNLSPRRSDMLLWTMLATTTP